MGRCDDGDESWSLLPECTYSNDFGDYDYGVGDDKAVIVVMQQLELDGIGTQGQV